MEINSPEQMMAAIKILLVQMNKDQRKQFLEWVKRHKREMDFNYPQGLKIKETTDEPKTEAPAAPVLTVPDTELIVPTNDGTTGGIIRA